VSSDRTPTFWRHVGLIFGVTALWLPLSMLFNSLQSLVLPVFVLRYVAPAHKGTVLGVILFVGLAAGALVQPLAGIYSDKHLEARGASSVWWGGRQPLIVGGVVLTLAFLAGFALASNLALLAIAYVGVTVTAGIAQAGFQGLLPDFVPANLRGSAAGLKGFLELLGSVLGFSVAGILIKKGHPSGVLLAISVLGKDMLHKYRTSPTQITRLLPTRMPLSLRASTRRCRRQLCATCYCPLQLLAISLVLVIGTLLSLALVREGPRLRSQAAMRDAADGVRLAGPVTTLARQASRETHPVPDIAGTPSVRGVFTRVLVARFLFLLGVYGIGHFLLYYIRDRLHLANAAGTTSVLFTAFTAETALVAIGAGVLSDRMGRLPVLWGGALLSALGALLLVPASTVTIILMGGSIMSMGSGLFASANWALAADLTPRAAGGRFFGLLALATGGAAALAGLFGILVDRAGYNPLFIVTALIFAGSAVALPRAAQVARAVHSAASGHLAAVAEPWS